MPFFKCDSGLAYFFHVPKCGGSSIEAALLAKGFKMSFYDARFWKKGNASYYKSSPQHITQRDFKSLFAEDIFSYKFALVRDPVSRLLSAYAWNRKRIGRLVSLEQFISKLEGNVTSKNDYFGAKYDNHFVPANRLIPEDCDVFYLEKDIKALEVKLQAKLGIDIDLSKQHNIGKYNVSAVTNIKGFLKKFLLPQSPKINDVSEQMISRIKTLYSEDYQRFNFE